ncbi:hypothetical protein SAMN05444959_10674 [Paracoccus seriniphilus]|uniref:Uncharacterized protein n=1 Tax=Paracoccus seriniphilus TaxID=184748 RepID=A0A239PUC1_9RHOB|nr:hypothetical protein SAMN05444959_10674 [Paracoccus seriniphilus]
MASPPGDGDSHRAFGLVAYDDIHQRRLADDAHQWAKAFVLQHFQQTDHADILGRIHDHRISRIDELQPWNWVPMTSVPDSQAA